MAKFSPPYIDWIESPDHGFYIPETWNIEKGMLSGEGRLTLFPYQRRILSHILRQNEDGSFPYTTVIWSQIKKSGKALAIDTPIPTPGGWIAIGDIEVGDTIYDSKGNPTKVTFVSNIMTDRPCYLLTFSDGSELVADGEHQWFVGSRLKLNGTVLGDKNFYWQTITTSDMLPFVDTASAYNKNNGIALKNFTLPHIYPIKTDNVDLLVPPYTMGAWLGDGTSASGRITISELDKEILDYIQEEGVPVKSNKNGRNKTPCFSFSTGAKGGTLECKQNTIMGRLRTLGVLQNKHIPDIYLRSGFNQRLSLLQGLMDTDGYIDDKGHAEYTTVDYKLAVGVWELFLSMGMKATITEGDATLNGIYISPKYRIHIVPTIDLPIFRLQRKRNKIRCQKTEQSRSLYRRIVSISPVQSVPVRCIQVENESHLYLAGRGFIPTHNTAISASIGAWFLECAPKGTQIYAISNSEGQSARLVLGDIEYHLGKHGGAHITRDKIEYPENDAKIYPVTKSYSSFAGGRFALTLYDELWGFVTESDRRRWDELQPIPTVPHSLRLVTSYAGFYGESELLYDLYLNGVGEDEDINGKGKKIPGLEDLPCWSNGSLFVFWDHEPRMPWQDERYYQTARATERPSSYIRLHENHWITSNEEFIPIEAWDLAASKFEQSAEIWNEHPYRYSPVYIGVDSALKHDCTGVVGVCPDEKLGKVVQIFHKKWTPVDGDILNLQLVEDYIVDKCKKFNVQEIVCDPSQMLQIMNRLRSMGYEVFEYTQAGGAMVKASQNLYDLLHNHNLWAYPSVDMREHLQNVVAQITSSGYRIVKDKTNRRVATKKIDLAVALAMAAERAVENMGISRVDPIVIEACLSKYSDNRPPKSPSYIPFELRD